MKDLRFVLVLTLVIFLVCVLSASALDSSDYVAIWLMDEGSGTTVGDASGMGNTGSIFGEPAWVTGMYGTALEFDADNDYVEVADADILDLVDGITLAAWVKVLEITSNNPNVVAKDHAYFLGYHTDQKKFRHGVHTDKWNVKAADADAEVPVGEWTHIALTYDGSSKMIYYRDGQATDEFDVANPLNVETSNITISAFQKVEDKSMSQKFKGVVDEVVLINRPLDVAEIGELMNGVSSASAVKPTGKLATTWSEIRSF